MPYLMVESEERSDSPSKKKIRGIKNHSAEGSLKEFIPNKKVSYAWQPKWYPPGFPETTVTWELEEIDSNKTRVGVSSFRLYRKRRREIILYRTRQRLVLLLGSIRKTL